MASHFTEQVLMVDDDPNVLNAFRRQLRGVFDVEFAQDPPSALRLLDEGKTFGVVVSDKRMPSMDGIRFLAMIRERLPEASRIMLTGFADLQTAIDAVNEGCIFRFLTKPCPPEVLKDAIRQGLNQHRLVTAERELTSQTLMGSIKTLIDLLALSNPNSFGRASRVRDIVKQLAGALEVEETWEWEIAALLAPVGMMAAPESLVARAAAGEALSEQESALLLNHAATAAQLLGNIPRLKEVAHIVAYQDKRFDGGGPPVDAVAGEQIPLAARALKLSTDFERLRSQLGHEALALNELRKRVDHYDPKLIDQLETIVSNAADVTVQKMDVHEAPLGSILAEDVITMDGQLLFTTGTEATSAVLLRLRGCAAAGLIGHEVRLVLPRGAEQQVVPDSDPVDLYA